MVIAKSQLIRRKSPFRFSLTLAVPPDFQIQSISDAVDLMIIWLSVGTNPEHMITHIHQTYGDFGKFFG